LGLTAPRTRLLGRPGLPCLLSWPLLALRLRCLFLVRLRERLRDLLRLRLRLRRL
jgi:hypothetical protein